MPAVAALEHSLTVRIPAELHSKLVQLAKVTGRTKSFYAVEALQERLELDLWQIEQTKQAISEADAGDFATPAELQAVLSKYGH
jgi:RHH-type transcriptional regulator, rel operon repressor / antitoxin RelB